MPDATTIWKPIEAWAARHRLLLGAFGHGLAFAVLFGGVALAATTSNSATVTSVVLGLVAIGLVKLFARSIPAAQRLIDTLHPEPHSRTKTDAFPNWALAVYALVWIALILTFIALEERPSYAAAALVAGAGAGRHVLEYFWTRRIKPETPRALDIIDDWLDATAEPHRPMLRVLGTALCFVLLFGGVALYAWQAGITRVAAAVCGPACLATPGFESLVAAGCGAAAIFFVTLYTRLTLAAQRVFFDPFQFVRPEPKPEKAATWVTVLHVVLGFILLFIMTGVGQMQIPHRMVVSADAPESAGLLLGWWIGGGVVLRFFWAKWRRGETVMHRAPAEPHRMQP